MRELPCIALRQSSARGRVQGWRHRTGAAARAACTAGSPQASQPGTLCPRCTRPTAPPAAPLQEGWQRRGSERASQRHGVARWHGMPPEQAGNVPTPVAHRQPSAAGMQPWPGPVPVMAADLLMMMRCWLCCQPSGAGGCCTAASGCCSCCSAAAPAGASLPCWLASARAEAGLVLAAGPAAGPTC